MDQKHTILYRWYNLAGLQFSGKTDILQSGPHVPTETLGRE